MTNKTLIHYAYLGVLNMWAQEKERLQNDPDNEITLKNERSLWKDFEIISDMLKEEEEK